MRAMSLLGDDSLQTRRPQLAALSNKTRVLSNYCAYVSIACALCLCYHDQ